MLNYEVLKRNWNLSMIMLCVNEADSINGWVMLQIREAIKKKLTAHITHYIDYTNTLFGLEINLFIQL
jgi:hypothetical protein